MKLKIFALSVLASFAFSSNAQHGDKEKRQSPPAIMEHRFGDSKVVIKYSQPSTKGRDIYGGLVPYGEVWRTGANEATKFITDTISIEGQIVPAGTYAFFTIPGEEEWTIILNSEANQWGAYKYDESKDVLRFTVKPTTLKMQETMTFRVVDNKTIVLDWEETRIPINIDVETSVEPSDSEAAETDSNTEKEEKPSKKDKKEKKKDK